MGEKRNLTVQLDAETIRKARVIAAERSTSVSRLVAEQIEQLVDADQRYRQAREGALAHLRQGYSLGGGPLPTRDQLHER